MIPGLFFSALSTEEMFRLLVCCIILVTSCVTKYIEDDKEIVATCIQIAVGDVAPQNGVCNAACQPRGCTVEVENFLEFQNFGTKSYFESLGAGLRTSLGERWRLHSQYVDQLEKKVDIDAIHQLYFY